MVVKSTSKHRISGPPLHKIGFSCSGGMQNRAFGTKHPPRYTNLMRWSPRTMSCLSLMYGQSASVVDSCSTLGPEVRGGTQNAITQKITERLSHHSAGQSFRNLIIIKQLCVTEKPMFSEGGNKRKLKRGQIIEKIVLGHYRGRYFGQQIGQNNSGPLGIPTKINQTGFAYFETGLTLSPRYR